MSWRRLWLAGFVLFTATVANAQTAKVYVSSQAGDRLAAKPELQFTDGKPASGATFEINDAARLQKIDGFGASFMEAGLMTLNTLPAGVRVMSFLTPHGGIVAQVLNSNASNSPVTLVHKGRSLRITAPAHSISTVTW